MSSAWPDKFKAACVTVGGSGYAPIASGTWGSAAAVLPFAVIWWICGTASAPRGVLEGLVVAGVLISSVLSVQFGEWAIARFGRKDPGQFVLDEFAGQWVALLLMPIGMTADLWSFACVVGGQFFLFRVMDVIKPPPARQLERQPAGWGILLDDLFAGAYANIVGQLLWRLTPLAAWLGVTH